MKFKFGVYEHYKGALYWAREIVLHTETEERLVIYNSVASGEAFARPLKMWTEKVKWPDGRRRARFVFKREMTQLG